MLLEFEADQRLWQETVHDAVGKQCPPALVRRVAEDGVGPAPVWKAYVEHGWTQMSDPENAVELAIVLEELGRATDPTPFLATMTQFAPLAGDRFDPQACGTGRHVLDGDRAEWLAVVTDAALHVALMGMAMTMVVACQRILDLVLDHVRSRQQFGVPIGSFQAVQHKAADMHVAIERARAGLLLGVDHRRERPAPSAGRRDGQSRCGRMPVDGVPARPATVRRDGLHLGE